MKLTKSQESRRNFLRLPLAAGATAVSLAAGPRKEEFDPDNTKIATMVDVRASDDELLFLKQIGLRWVHAEFGNNAPYDVIKNFQERLGHYGIKIHCGILD